MHVHRTTKQTSVHLQWLMGNDISATHSPVSLFMLLPVKLNLSVSINIYIDSVFC